MTLTDFLLQRIAEDEEAARFVDTAAAEYGGDDIQWHWIRYYRRSPRSPHSSATFEGAWDPGRVLAECEAKRQIVEACQVDLEGLAGDLGLKPEEVSTLSGLVLRALALPYSDHPQFDPAWQS